MSTLTDHVVARLRALCDVLALDPERVITTARHVISPWADVPPEALSAWPSEIADDHTPIELSVAFARDAASLRILFEPQGARPELAAFRVAGLACFERLGQRYGADLERFRRVQDLFLPEAMQGRFAVWGSVVFDGAHPSFKAYLNPQAQGAAVTHGLVEEALTRLGLHGAWANLREAALQRGVLDDIKYFALDLERGAAARVKVYVHHHHARPRDLEVACSHSRNFLDGRVLELARALRGSDEPMRARAPFTCHAFSSDAPERAVATAYVPVCAYARDDAEVSERFSDYLEHHGLSSMRYRRILAAAATRELAAGVGLQSWIALRSNGDDPRFTVYLATEANRIYAPGSVPAPSVAPVEA